MNSTRPDIAYVVTRLSRYTHNPDKSHWITLDRVARYLKGTSLQVQKAPHTSLLVQTAPHTSLQV